MASSHRSRLLERVLEARRPLAERLGRTRSALEHFERALVELDAERARVIVELDGPNAAKARARLEGLDLARLRLGLEEQRRSLLRLEARFRRDHLALGVVGRARQGKSRLLQTLTGLGSDVIPDGDRTHCTGVRSTLIHRPGVEPHAEVFLHTERSFLDEVVAPYHDALPELGPAPRALDGWARPRVEERLLGARGAKLTHLQRTHDALPRFRPLLSEPSPKRVPIRELRPWVAQSSADGETVYTQHLAVREVEITCAFPDTDLARLAVVDMPGLGDTGVGDEARLLYTLGHAVDAVVFVRMPKALGDHWADVDVELYDLARRAVPELPLERWCWFVLNRTRPGAKQGDNLRNCQDLLDGTAAQGLAAVRHAVIDVSDRGEVLAELLDPMLEHLAAGVEELDRAYAQTCRASLQDFVNEARILLEEAASALAQAGSGDRENPLYRRLFDHAWEEITGRLEGYLAHLQRRRQDEDPDLAVHIQDALAAARAETGIPDAAAIERRRHARGSYAIAYNELLHEVRTGLSRHFLQLDDGLKRSLGAVKDGVGTALRGPLGAVSDRDGVGFLQDLRARLPPEAPAVGEGFDMLLGFDLSYRGLIQHRIRRHLDGLTPDLTTLQLSARPDPQEIRTYLETLHKEALYQAEQALRGLLYEPSQAAFAMVEEFLDRVLRAKGARTEWDLFLFEIRSEVWRGEFDRLEARTRTRRRWESAASAVLDGADPARYPFLAE